MPPQTPPASANESRAAEPRITRRTIYILIVVALLILISGVVFALQMLQVTAAKDDETVKNVLIVRNPPALDIVWIAAHDEMNTLGHEDERGIHYVITEVAESAPATKERIRTLLNEQDIDLIMSIGILATRSAKEVTAELGRDTPIVFAVVSDPVGAGLVASMSSSGNNLTGITPSNEFVASKRLEFLREMLPSTMRIIYAWNDVNTSGIDGLRRVAPSLEFELLEQQVATRDEMNAFIDSFEFKKGDALLRASDSIGAGSLPHAIEAAIAKKVPLVGTNSIDTERGALMSYGADYAEIGKLAARMMISVLSGTLPARIPIEEASVFDVSVNTETAGKIGVVVPQTFLLKVGRIYPAQ